MGLGLYGKHPGRGDFLDHGLPAPMQRALETWLDGALAEARAELGAAWEGAWAAAPVLRFWLGEAIWGHTVCGVMAPSADRVGRRFPLVFLYVAPDATSAPPPPVTEPDQGWYDRAEAALRAQLANPAPGPGGDMLTGLRPPQGDGQAGDAGFWARRAEGGPVDLWADVAQTDHRRAAAGRSYWWVALTAEKAPPEPESWGTDEDIPPAEEEAVEDEDQGADEDVETDENGSVPAEHDPDEGEAEPPEITEEDGEDDDPFSELPEEEDSPFGAPSEGSNGLLAQASAWASDAVDTGSPWDEPAAPEPAPVPEPAPTVTPAARQAAPEGPRLYAGPGLPEGAVLGWLLGGGA